MRRPRTECQWVARLNVALSSPHLQCAEHEGSDGPNHNHLATAEMVADERGEHGAGKRAQRKAVQAIVSSSRCKKTLVMAHSQSEDDAQDGLVAGLEQGGEASLELGVALQRTAMSPQSLPAAIATSFSRATHEAIPSAFGWLVGQPGSCRRARSGRVALTVIAKLFEHSRGRALCQRERRVPPVNRANVQ